MVTIETADNALKSYYLDAVKDVLDYKINPFLAKLEHSSVDVTGKDVRKLVRVGISGGIGAGTETGNLPTSRTAQRVQLVSSLKNLYGTLEISDKAIRASANNEGAFVNLLNEEIETLIKGASFHFGRMLFGDGSGYLATVVAAMNNEIIVDSVNNIVEGMVVDVYKDGEPIATAQQCMVTSVDRENKIFYLDGAPGGAVSWEDAKIYVHNGKENELTGLLGVFNNDELYGLNKEEYTFMRPHIKIDVGDISENIIQRTIDFLEENTGSRTNFIICSWGVKRALMEYYRNLSTVLPTVEFENGEKAMAINGVPVVADRFCPKGTMYLLNTNDFKLHQLCDWKWLEGEDGKILKQVPGKPVYTATLVKYAELMCERPCGQAMITGIKEK